MENSYEPDPQSQFSVVHAPEEGALVRVGRLVDMGNESIVSQAMADADRFRAERSQLLRQLAELDFKMRA